jgi:5,10-methylenetetrahydromethanopterin reductase
VQISIGLPPSPAAVEHARLAEQLGYARVWVYDSPALYGDVWVQLALIAQATDRIGIGTGVAVPSTRHVMTTASAIAQIEGLAPGRLACAFGTGFTARMAMGKKALSWDTTATYLRQLRGLLAGETVEVDGAMTRMIHPAGFIPDRPIRTPILVGANGPKGLEIGRELGDGIMCVGSGQPGFDWCALLCFGTVLDDGESLGSPRVLDAAGPSYVMMYHGLYEAAPTAVDGLPMGQQWREAVEAAEPEGQRHLAVHDLHLVGVTERDRPFVEAAGDMIGAVGWTGDAAAIRARVALAGEQGVTEVLYAPAGSDIPRELEAFAKANGLG